MIKHIIISGKVQGVGFRHFTMKKARELGLTGWVKNLADGNVEAVFEGDDQNVESMLIWCRKGPIGSYVTNMKELEVTSVKRHYEEFNVLH